MKKTDHLDNNVAIAAQLVERGIQLKAQSRAVSGIDRLLGNLSELVNAPIERRNARIRAEQDIIEALRDEAVARIKDGRGIAQQILETKINRVAQEHFNKEEVVAAAIEDLRNRPPTPEQAADGPDQLDSTFLNRFERYAEQADDLLAREKWARVLSGEIRQPGRFSLKTMRLIDEISQDAAENFRSLCRHRVGDCVPKYLSGILKFSVKTSLENAGLIVPSSDDTLRIFHSKNLKKMNSSDSIDVWFGAFGNRALAINQDVPIPKSDNDTDFIRDEDGLNLPVYLLTADGQSVASLGDDGDGESWERLIKKYKTFLVGLRFLSLRCAVIYGSQIEFGLKFHRNNYFT